MTISPYEEVRREFARLVPMFSAKECARHARSLMRSLAPVGMGGMRTRANGRTGEYYGAFAADSFSIDFELVWRLTGYSRKDAALRLMTSNPEVFVEGRDFIVRRPSNVSGRHGGHNKKDVHLTGKSFAQFLVLARTPQSNALAVFFNRLGLAHFSLLEDVPAAKIPGSYRRHASEARADLWHDLVTIRREVSEHDRVASALAAREGGRTEVTLPSGLRVDVLTATEVIEVKPATEWMHGVGQVLAYAHEARRAPRLHLLSPPISAMTSAVCETSNVRLTWERRTE